MKIGLKKFQRLLTAINLITRIKFDEFKYVNIKDLVNNIRNNTIIETDAKKDLNELNEIKNEEIIKYKKCTPGHNELLYLFNNSLESENQEDKNEKSRTQKRRK